MITWHQCGLHASLPPSPIPPTTTTPQTADDTRSRAGHVLPRRGLAHGTHARFHRPPVYFFPR